MICLFPENFQRCPLRVVIDTGKPDECLFTEGACRSNLLDQILSRPNPYKCARFKNHLFEVSPEAAVY
jgi:hypothetical protein